MLEALNRSSNNFIGQSSEENNQLSDDSLRGASGTSPVMQEIMDVNEPSPVTGESMVVITLSPFDEQQPYTQSTAHLEAIRSCRMILKDVKYCLFGSQFRRGVTLMVTFGLGVGLIFILENNKVKLNGNHLKHDTMIIPLLITILCLGMYNMCATSQNNSEASAQ